MAFPVLTKPRKCVICGKDIKLGRRYDTIYCGPNCKQRAYTARLRKAKNNG
jgi:predicted RNA-binding Zn-ribbon protein involved in translation (DUF1610 family)